MAVGRGSDLGGPGSVVTRGLDPAIKLGCGSPIPHRRRGLKVAARLPRLAGAVDRGVDVRLQRRVDVFPFFFWFVVCVFFLFFFPARDKRAQDVGRGRGRERGEGPTIDDHELSRRRIRPSRS